MDENVETTTHLILQIARLLIQGEDLEKLFTKENEKVIVWEIYEKYDMKRGIIGVLINLISDDNVSFAT